MDLLPSDLDLRDLNTAHGLVDELDTLLLVRHQHFVRERIDLPGLRAKARQLVRVLAAIERRQAKRREQRDRRGSVLTG